MITKRNEIIKKFRMTVEDPMWADHYEGSKKVGREILDIIRDLQTEIATLKATAATLQELAARKGSCIEYKKLLDKIASSTSEDPKALKGMADYKMLLKK